MAIRTKNTDKLKFRKDANGDYVITLKDVRLSYEHIFEPWCKTPAKETPRYSGKFMAGNETHEAEIESLNNFFDDLKKEWFKGQKIKAADICFRDGDLESKEEMEGHWILSASEKKTHPPAVIDRDKTKIDESDDKVYSGTYVDVMFKPWKQDNDFGKRINANLMAVQFRRKGERLGGGGGVSKEDLDEGFDEIDGEDDDGFDD